MAYLYQSYCYSTLQDVANQIKSNLVLEGFGLVNNTLPLGSGSINIYYRPIPTSTTATTTTSTSPVSNPYGTTTTQPAQQTYVFTPPLCEKLGYASSFSGLDQKDSLLISESVVAVLILAWTFKVVSRSL
jgi:hypothetical protein